MTEKVYTANDVVDELIIVSFITMSARIDLKTELIRVVGVNKFLIVSILFIYILNYLDFLRLPSVTAVFGAVLAYIITLSFGGREMAERYNGLLSSYATCVLVLKELCLMMENEYDIDVRMKDYVKNRAHTVKRCQYYVLINCPDKLSLLAFIDTVFSVPPRIQERIEHIIKTEDKK